MKLKIDTSARLIAIGLVFLSSQAFAIDNSLSDAQKHALDEKKVIGSITHLPGSECSAVMTNTDPKHSYTAYMVFSKSADSVSKRSFQTVLEPGKSAEKRFGCPSNATYVIKIEALRLVGKRPNPS